MQNQRNTKETNIQRAYYSKIANCYHSKYVRENDEHFVALSWLSKSLEDFSVTSVLDIGAGTGRAITYLKHNHPGLRIAGIEPVKELREVAYANGISKEELTDGDALQLKFNNNEFDLVCEFGVLHHIRTPEFAVSEMLRVAKKGIFISDINTYGEGSTIERLLKRIIKSLGLWKAAVFVKTKGKGYLLTDGDGLSYPYSVFDNYNQITKQCENISLLSTKKLNIKNGMRNLYRTASHVAMLAIKKGDAK